MKNSSNYMEDNNSMFEPQAENLLEHIKVERVKNPNPRSAKYYHYHDFYELYYMYSGERYYFVKDKTYHVKAGTLVLVKPYDIHYTTNYAKQGYDRHLIWFSKEYLKELLPMYSGNLFESFNSDISIIKLNLHSQHFVETLFKSMQKEFDEKKEGYELYLKTSLAQLLIFMNRNRSVLQENDIDYINSAHKTVSEITAYINQNFKEDITLSSISKKFFISSYYLSRIFKKNTGFSFVEYLNSIRIKEAQKLLIQTENSIAEISEMVGYNSATHFGRIFKNITGTSPLLYKKLHKKQN
ncbi:MAG: AraC family transcriptional regulator [Clostridia bacterium]|nr:AraC family transcriptional regulator [Clostridia bacterium]